VVFVHKQAIIDSSMYYIAFIIIQKYPVQRNNTAPIKFFGTGLSRVY